MTRPSGTEEIYEIYAESVPGQDNPRQIEEEAQTICFGGTCSQQPSGLSQLATRRS